MLPATGAPVSRQRTSKMKEMFDEYVRVRTRDNWKFWIVSFFTQLPFSVNKIKKKKTFNFCSYIFFFLILFLTQYTV